jgi:predicted CXXCH cytochrome family protein
MVGGSSCAGCHPAEYALWVGSDHDAAMQVATSATVLGNFAAEPFDDGSIRAEFIARDGEFLIRTPDEDGADREYRVAYTFGIAPLQQYLVELDDDRLQAFGLAWDTRSAGAGGQRWFNLNPGAAGGDPLHWTGPYQTWNAMCAECHSTGLQKGYDLRSDRFATTWTSIDVDCEACHGPGGAHAADPSVALPVRLVGSRRWSLAEGARIAALAPETPATAEVDTCAGCHARRVEISEQHVPGEPLLDAFRPALLDAGLYEADGQILDEVYVYGSFQQSRMAAAGVVCSDCHEPHSLGLRASGNALCGRCHAPDAYDTSEHHRHAPGSAGAECVSCHMASRNYMQVDPRRDHSFRVPRPDLSVRLNTPNACTGCHADRPDAWAAERVAAWYPQGRSGRFHFGEALAAARGWSVDRADLLLRVAGDPTFPAIARATALQALAEQPAPGLDALLRRSLADPEPLLRLAAVEAAAMLPAAERVDGIARLLDDPLRAVRIAAARSLATMRVAPEPARQDAFNDALAEYIEAQSLAADRGDGLVALAGLATDLGQANEAERYLQAAVDRFPALSVAYLNLADLYRVLGREDQARAVLGAGLTINPDDAGLHAALGLAEVRVGEIDAAIRELAAAATLSPAEPRYAYLYGVALSSVARQGEALDMLRQAHLRFPGHRDTLLALATIARDAGRREEALTAARALRELAPADQAVLRLIAALESLPAE